MVVEIFEKHTLYIVGFLLRDSDFRFLLYVELWASHLQRKALFTSFHHSKKNIAKAFMWCIKTPDGTITFSLFLHQS